MQTAHDRLGALAEAVAKAPDFGEPARRVALATYRRLAEGTAASADEIAERAGESVELTEHLLGLWSGVFRDEGRHVVGFRGLTTTELVPTHAIEVDGRRLFAGSEATAPLGLHRTCVTRVCPTVVPRPPWHSRRGRRSWERRRGVRSLRARDGDGPWRSHRCGRGREFRKTSRGFVARSATYRGSAPFCSWRPAPTSSITGCPSGGSSSAEPGGCRSNTRATSTGG
jgi:hypothetical protein